MAETIFSINHLKHSTTSTEPIGIPRLRNIEIIRNYINAQPEEINKLKEYYSQFMTILNEFASLTQNYSKKLGETSNKIKVQKYDEETLEGKLLLILKNQFMKNSDILNKISEEIKKETNKIYKGKTNIINTLNNVKSDYENSIKNVRSQVKYYKQYMSKYEDYLIDKELKKTKNKKEKLGNFVERQTTFNESNKIDSLLENEKISNDVENKELTKNTLESQQKYFNLITESNNILKKIIDISSNEKISIRGNILAEFCSVSDKITCFFRGQKDNFSNEKQNVIPGDITDYLRNLKEEQELSTHFLKPVLYNLKCLEKNSNTKTQKVNKERKLSYDFEKDSLPNLVTGATDSQKNYKLTSKIIVNIINEMKSNKIILSKHDEIIENEEKDKIFIKKTAKQILKNDNSENLNDENKKKLLQKMENRNNQDFFLKFLNDYRAKGQFNIDKIQLEFFGEIFKYIANICLNNEDMDIYKLLFVISSTFFYDDGKKKHFLTDYIENHSKYKEISFWVAYLESQIKWELNNLKSKKSEEEIKNNEQKMLKTITFSTLLTVIKNMSDLHIDNEFINKFVNKVNEKYPMNEIQMETINILLTEEANNKEEDKTDEGNTNKEDIKDKENVNKEEDDKKEK